MPRVLARWRLVSLVVAGLCALLAPLPAFALISSSQPLNLTNSTDTRFGFFMTAPPSGNALAFSESYAANAGAIGNLWTAKTDGTELRQVTTGLDSKYDPAWSPDESWIAFRTFSAAGDPEIHAIHPDGTGERVALSLKTNYAGICWLPDSRRLITRVFVDGAAHLLLVDPEASTVTTLPTPVGTIAHSLSPDGSKLAIVTAAGSVSGAVDGIWTMNVDGTGLTQIVSGTRWAESSGGLEYFNCPGWTPDSSRISFGVYRHARVSTQPDYYELWTVSVDGVDQRLLGFSRDGLGECPFSPDGRYVLYTDYAPTSGMTETTRTLSVMAADGTGLTIPVGYGSDAVGDPTWLPGDRIAFRSNRDIFVTTVTGVSAGDVAIQPGTDSRALLPAWGGQVVFDQVRAPGRLTVAPSVVATSRDGYTPVTGACFEVTTTAGFAGPVTMTVPYNEADIGGVDESTLRLFHWKNGQWWDITVSVDTVNNTITGATDSFSPFAVMVPSFTVTPTASSQYGSISGAKTVVAGADATFTVTAKPGYHVARVWLDANGPDLVNVANVYTVARVLADHTISASFEPDAYVLHYTAGRGGTISGDASQTVLFGGHGTTVTAQASGGYRFVGWSDGKTSAARADSPDAMTGTTFTANFVADAPPTVPVYTPHAPSTMRRGHSYTVYGYVALARSGGAYLVTLKFYLRSPRGVYVYHHSVSARRYSYSRTKSKYSARVSLPHKGRWAVRAYRVCAKHTTSASGYDYIRVR